MVVDGGNMNGKIFTAELGQDLSAGTAWSRHAIGCYSYGPKRAVSGSDRRSQRSPFGAYR